MISDRKPPEDTSTYSLPEALSMEVASSLESWKQARNMHRLWVRDATLWTDHGENRWLGWLDLTEHSDESAEELRQLQEQVLTSGVRDVVVLGMGGSSLCPEVLAFSFRQIHGFPRLRILDSTDPAQIRELESTLDLSKTLFIVSSKSGSTLEPNIFKKYFYDRVEKELGSAVGERFIAVTDPGSQLEEAAKKERFSRIVHGVPSVGGRYSALSAFGMVPGAAMGLDVTDFLERADAMAAATSSSVPVETNPGARLGTVLGLAAKQGRDKLTLVASPSISDLGAWLEQLVAESTGKQGKAIIPVDREELGPPGVYGDDRIFAYLRLDAEPDAAQDEAMTKLAEAGQPIVRISISEVKDLGQEFFRWEIATAVAGAILGINPFDQPDVEASKVATLALTTEFETAGRLPEEVPIFEDHGIQLHTDRTNADALGEQGSLAGFLRAHLDRLGDGDYFAILAYVHMNRDNESVLQDMRHAVRNHRRVATCLGFGPRFLHSTGQAYKGGPNTGVFLQVTHDEAEDLLVPGQKYTFGVVKAAQARGDFEVLAERDRRVLRAHLGSDVGRDLERLKGAVQDVLS